MKIYKPKFWHEKISFLSAVIFPLSIIFQILVFLRRKLIKKISFDVPIICVGNIYIGGTGKTPLVLKIYDLLKKSKKKPAIIKKEYVNLYDEINLIKFYKKEIFTNKSRPRAIRTAIKTGFNSLVLDDGFQDHSIHKDINILCFSSNQLIGNGLTIPAGPLRESFNRITNAQIIVINGKRDINFERKIRKVSNKIKIFYSYYEIVKSKKLLNKNILAFAGIGNPENFFKTLKENNFKVKKSFSFPDHYDYSKSDLIKMINIAKNNKIKIVTTEKDFFRIKKFNFKDIKSINVKLKIKKQKKFLGEIQKIIK
jgi:tetraacyldisaccharide 4'-kinase